MPPFEAHLKDRLATLHRQWSKSWPDDEWDQLLASLRSTLRMVTQIGGDPDFVLFVLTDFRWRRTISKHDPDYKNAAELLQRVDRLKKANGPVWKELGAGLSQIRASIRRILWVEEGLFDREMRPERRMASHRIYRCLYVLNQYLKKALPRRKTSREELLVEIVDSSGLRYWDESSPKEWGGDPREFVHKRLSRARTRVHLTVDQWTRVYGWESLLAEYHWFRSAVGLKCGSACQYLPTDRMQRQREQR